MSFDLFSRLPHLPSRNLIHERLIRQSVLSVPTDDDGQHQFGVVDAIAGEITQRSHSQEGAWVNLVLMAFSGI